MIFNEIKQHGTQDFPFELYNVSKEHPRYTMVHHWHSAIEIIYVISGDLTVKLDDHTYEAKAGDILLSNCNVVHGAVPHDCVYQCMAFDPAFLRTGNQECNLFIEGLLHQEFLLPEQVTDEQMREVILQLFQIMQEEKKGFRFRAMGLCAQLFSVALEKNLYQRAYHDESTNQKVFKLKKVLRFIRENFMKDITLEDMANEADLSTKYFCSFFKTMTGTTAVNYLLTYRIEQAARSLLATDKSVTQISFDSGFNDLSYFIKTFKQLKGMPPKQYRRIF